MKNPLLKLSIIFGIMGSVASFIISGYIYFTLNTINVIGGVFFCSGIVGALGSITIKGKPILSRTFMLLPVICIMGILCLIAYHFLPTALLMGSLFYLQIASLASIPIAFFIAVRALSYRGEEESMEVMIASAMGKAGSITFLFLQIITLWLWLPSFFLSTNYTMITFIAMRFFYILLGISGLIGAFKVTRTLKTGGVLMLIAGSVLSISWVWGIVLTLISYQRLTFASISIDTAIPMLFLLSGGILALINNKQAPKVNPLIN